MNKMIAIIDRPGDCFDCPLLHRDLGINHKCVLSNKFMNSIDLTKRLDWCLLKQVPEKQVRDYPEYDEYITGYDDGWDACIDDILGE